jgi:dolichol-phosphate mannosyltransferase
MILCPRIFIVIPVLNEAGNIPRLMDSLTTLSNELKNKYEVRIVLIDDGSQDQTSALAKKSAIDLNLNLEILRHEHNLGPGRAFGTGFKFLATQLTQDDLVITMEGDNTSRIELIKQMLHRLEEDFDVIFASPYLYGGRIINTSVYRVFLSSMANLLIKELLGIQGILTASSFFRLYKTAALKKLQSVYGPEIIERAGFECMVEMLIKMVNLQMTISEVPLLLDTHARVGKSRMKIMRTIRGYLALWFLKRRWKRMCELAPATHSQ